MSRQGQGLMHPAQATPPCRALHSLNLPPDVAPCQLLLLLLLTSYPCSLLSTVGRRHCIVPIMVNRFLSCLSTNNVILLPPCSSSISIIQQHDILVQCEFSAALPIVKLFPSQPSANPQFNYHQLADNSQCLDCHQQRMPHHVNRMFTHFPVQCAYYRMTIVNITIK